ncbi:MAG: Nif3-like dinuclear metal center hexameric protein [Dysgonamonadaceae bacterium]|jgi:dinuclear metal center YbgI/SA1388 family protein|nr:Nif3-like dinuclear metal center hexameric protein [Dysgonamonadaceae bacterium]
MKIAQILGALEEFAPLPLQDDFDNSGLQVGDTTQKVKGILLCLDVTEDVIDEAVELDCNLIISHHPLLFRPLKSLTGKTYIERCIVKACKNDIVIYAAHTNIDNVRGGVSFRLAEKIGLQNIKILKPQNNSLLKLVTFVPENQAEQVRTALFHAGAGTIGNYDFCSYNSSGEGTFRAGENTNPFVGEKGEIHVEKETRIEVVLPTCKKASVTRALLTTHPYEEPAYDFYLLQNEWSQAGAGVVGELPVEEDEKSFLQRIKTIFRLESLKHSPLTGKMIKEVALCGGSGSFLIKEAMAYGADVFLTGEAKYNDYFDVENKILLAVLGHYESEHFIKELFFEIISKKMPNFAIHFSNLNANPVNYM